MTEFRCIQNSQSIPSGWHLATKEEVERNKSAACRTLGAWTIAKLAGGWKIDGAGYGNHINRHEGGIGDQVIAKDADSGGSSGDEADTSRDLEKYNRNCDMVKKWESTVNGFGDISTLSGDQRSSMCVKAKAVLEEMIVQLNNDVKILAGQEESLQKQFEDVAQKTVDAQVEVTANEKELKRLQTNLVQLEKELEGHEDRLRDLDREIRDLQAKKDEAIRRRTNALKPPVVGFFEGIMEGRPERMIPGYDQVNAVVSFCEQDYENAQRRQSDKRGDRDKCKQKISSTRSDVDNKASAVRSSKSRLKALEAKRDRLTKAQGVIAQQKTGVNTRQKTITDLRDRTGFLEKDAKIGAAKQDVKKIFENKMNKVISELRPVMSGMSADYKVTYDQAQELQKLLK